MEKKMQMESNGQTGRTESTPKDNVWKHWPLLVWQNRGWLEIRFFLRNTLKASKTKLQK